MHVTCYVHVHAIFFCVKKIFIFYMKNLQGKICRVILWKLNFCIAKKIFHVNVISIHLSSHRGKMFIKNDMFKLVITIVYKINTLPHIFCRLRMFVLGIYIYIYIRISNICFHQRKIPALGISFELYRRQLLTVTFEELSPP